MRLRFVNLIQFSLLSGLLFLVLIWRIMRWGDSTFSNDLIVQFGYWFTFVLIGVFSYKIGAVVLRHCQSSQDTRAVIAASLLRHRFPILLILLLTAVIHSHEPHRLRTMNDEYAFLSTSQMAHSYKTVAIPSRMIYFDNQPLYVGANADIRLPLFPVLVSFIHDVTGYRVSNVFVANFMLTGVFLSLIYCLVLSVANSRRLGCLALLLIFSIPLLAQVATSGGYDLLNVTLITALALIALNYERDPTHDKQTLLIYAALLLAFCRYESILYLGVVAFLVGRNWLRQRELRLRLLDALSPVFLMIPIAYNLYYTGQEAFKAPQIGGEVLNFFSIKYFPSNMGEAVSYFFLDPTTSSTSALVSILGLVSCAYLMAFVVTKAGKEKASSFSVAYSPIVLVILTIMSLVMCNYWGQLTDYQAVRFALPVLTGVVPVIIWFIHHNKLHSRQWMIFWFGVSGFYSLAFSLPAQAQHHTTNSMIPSFGREFMLDYSLKHGNERTVFLSKASLGIIAHGRPSISLAFADANPDRIIEGFQYGHYDSIFTDNILSYDRELAGFVVNTSIGALSDDYRLETVETKRYSALLTFRIAKVVAIRNSSGEWVDVLTRPGPQFKTDPDKSVLLELLKKVP